MMYGRDAYALLIQLLNQKIRKIDDNNSSLGLNVFTDRYTLAIHNIKLPTERRENQFLIYLIPEFHVADQVVGRNPVSMCGIPNIMLLFMWYM